MYCPCTVAGGNGSGIGSSGGGGCRWRCGNRWGGRSTVRAPAIINWCWWWWHVITPCGCVADRHSVGCTVRYPVCLRCLPRASTAWRGRSLLLLAGSSASGASLLAPQSRSRAPPLMLLTFPPQHAGFGSSKLLPSTNYLASRGAARPCDANWWRFPLNLPPAPSSLLALRFASPATGLIARPGTPGVCMSSPRTATLLPCGQSTGAWLERKSTDAYKLRSPTPLARPSSGPPCKFFLANEAAA